MVGWFIRGGKKVGETIKSVRPNIPTTKIEKAKSKLNIAIQKTKASKAKLKQTIFDIHQKKNKKQNLKRNLGKKWGFLNKNTTTYLFNYGKSKI